MKKSSLIRALSLMAAASLALSACGGTSTTASASSSASSAPASSASSASSEAASSGAASSEAASSQASGEESFICSEEPLTLTAHIHWGSTQVLQDGNWPIINKAAEMTNVTLKGTASPMETDSTQAFNLMIASKDIPDMVGGNRNLINQYGMEGAFMPLNDLIEEYAPDFKKVLDANPDILGAITAADGNIYQVPFVYEELLSEAWFIRQDWLDKLNLEVPKTVQEFHDVLTAFVNNDPNGNGQKDEVGIFTRLSGATDNKVLSVLALFGVSDYWHTNDEGKVAIGLYTDAYKDAIKNVSQWYAEGLIDKEIFTRGNKSRDMLFPENNGGAIHDWIPSTSGYNPKISQTVPGFKLVGMLPPTDINGDQWEVASRDKLDGAGWAISANNKHPEESMKYMNFWWTETGRRLSTYGIEGEDYTMVDGKPVYTDKVLKAADPINVFIRNMGGMINDIGYLHDATYENFMMDEEGQKTKTLYNESGVVMKKNPKLPALSFTQEELDLVNSKYPPCRTYMLEQLEKWTFDGSTIDAEFDNYMATLKSMGMDEIVATYQAAYDRLMAQ